ncbi:hypothetical protein [Microlunatus flavus]|uniref:Uncharacterized protein n=1 Tax=Microlunatus flavus TaxID=1036181 RepID=A0A1H9IWW1_9ACTN|nr:hypothetical protein [Microlunatus flavus]SEQ79074.1 hypothetical protein SAMN05421756_10612 [Microlunatus flavus]
MTRHASLVGTLTAAVLLLAACGGPASPAPSSAPTGPVGTDSPSTASASPGPSAGVSVPADAANIGDSIQYDDDVEVTITQFTNAGDRTTLTVEVDDKAGEPVDGPVDVQASYGAQHLAAAPVPGGKPVAVPVAPRTRASGTYTFTIPAKSRGTVAVDVALGTDRDHAQFQGSVR